MTKPPEKGEIDLEFGFGIVVILLLVVGAFILVKNKAFILDRLSPLFPSRPSVPIGAEAVEPPPISAEPPTPAESGGSVVNSIRSYAARITVQGEDKTKYYCFIPARIGFIKNHAPSAVTLSDCRFVGGGKSDIAFTLPVTLYLAPAKEGTASQRLLLTGSSENVAFTTTAGSTGKASDKTTEALLDPEEWYTIEVMDNSSGMEEKRICFEICFCKGDKMLDYDIVSALMPTDGNHT